MADEANSGGRGAPLLVAADLVKSFGGFRAVDGVSLSLQTGSINALIGPNGAGKTTCFNLLTKQLPPTSGSIRYRGADITECSPDEVARLGIARSFQISSTFPSLTVLENVRIALQRKRGRSFDFWRTERILAQYQDEAMRLLNEVGLADSAQQSAGQLSYGRKRALEIATTLALDPMLMLLDEPTAGVAPNLAYEIFEQIADLRGEGLTFLIVEHRLEILFDFVDHLFVMHLGSLLAQGSPAEIAANAQVKEVYFGE